MVSYKTIIYKQKNKACAVQNKPKRSVVNQRKPKNKMKGVSFMYENIPEVMTLKECQEILKIGKNTMLELLHTRQIEGFKIGSRWKIPKESVVEFLRYQ